MTHYLIVAATGFTIVFLICSVVPVGLFFESGYSGWELVKEVISTLYFGFSGAYFSVASEMIRTHVACSNHSDIFALAPLGASSGLVLLGVLAVCSPRCSASSPCEMTAPWWELGIPKRNELAKNSLRGSLRAFLIYCVPYAVLGASVSVIAAQN